MRRPGFLGETSYWFGSVNTPRPRRRNGLSAWARGFSGFGANPCVVCNNGICTNTCTKEEQMSNIKSKHANIRRVAAKTDKFNIAKDAPTSPEFALRAGESQNQRLARLQKAKLYVPGAKMSHDYANLVNWGTTDRAKIAQLKRQVQTKVQKQNIDRYQTTDIAKIVEIEKQRLKEKEAMWQRVYGTKNPDKVYAIPAATRKMLCDADAECIRIRKLADG